MSSGKIHILFHSSAAGTLRAVLDEAGSHDQVICLWDNLSHGPIESLDPVARYEALVDEGLAESDDRPWLTSDSARFWKQCDETRRERILWVTRRSPPEMSGFLAYLQGFGDQPCWIVDVEAAEDRLKRRNGEPYGPVYGTGELADDNIRALLDRARPLTSDEAASAGRLWEQLVRENAPLRIPGGEGLVSAPATLVDDRLLSECSAEWKPTVRVLANTLGHLPEERGFALDQVFLEWRIDALLAQGALESRENAGQAKSSRFWRKAWIRRRQP